MNREQLPLTSVGAVGIPGGSFSAAELRLNSASDEAFQKLLLRITAKVGEKSNSPSLIHLFCRATREFFGISGVYFWRRHAGDELVGEQADGKLAERFIGMRLRPDESAAASEAVRQRRVILANHLQAKKFPIAAEFGARSLMAAPLLVSNEVIGAVTFLHDSIDDFFNEDLAAKATILAGQLGSLLEATRLGEVSQEEHRRAEILADVAHVLHGSPDVSAVIEALADRLRLLLRTRLVCVLLRREGPFELRAVSADSPQLANSARARHDRQTIRFAADLAQRAVVAGEAITVSIGADVHSLGNLVSPGMLIAAPFRTSRTQGTILVYPRADGVFTPEEKALVSAIAGFGAVAVAHAELHATAHAQAHELHQLLEIASELSSSSDLDHFLQAFVIRASDFLGFGRCFVALMEDNQFRVRYGVEKGEPRRLDVPFPEGVATEALRAKQVFWTDEASRTPGANLEVVAQYHVHQFLAVPLLGTNGDVLGMFGMLDRLDGTGISQEDIRRARALSNQAAVVLEAASNLHASEKHRRRAVALIELAREIDGALRLSDFARRFVSRAVELTNSGAGLLAVKQEGQWQIVTFQGQHSRVSTGITESQQLPGGQIPGPALDRSAERIVGAAVADFVDQGNETVVSGGLSPCWARRRRPRCSGMNARSYGFEPPAGRWLLFSDYLDVRARSIRKTACSSNRWPAKPGWRSRIRACLPGWSRRTGIGWRFSMPSPISLWCTIRREKCCA